MKVSAIIRICIWSLVAVLLIGLMLGVLNGKIGALRSDGNWNIGLNGHTYPNASEYVAGNAEIKDAVRAIDLEWVSGTVKVVGYDGDTLCVSEQTTATDTDMQLHWRYKNETLYIQPCASKWFFSVLSWEKKNVTVEIPYSMLSSFTSIEIESTDASVEISDVTTDALKVETVGGKIDLANITAEVIELESVSSYIEGQALNTSTLEAETISGRISLEGSFRHLRTDTVSGSVALRDSIAPSSAEFDSVSGDVMLYCPLDEGFTLDFETVSGGFDCDYPINKRGTLHVCGDGKGDFDADTVSGNFYIKQP